MRFMGAGLVILAVAACAATAGCRAGGGEEKPPVAKSAKPSVSRSTPSAMACPPAPVVKAPGAGADLRPAINAAARYLAVRENRLSVCQTSPDVWKRRLERLMTKKGRLYHPEIGNADAAAHDEAKRHGWYVRATVTCHPNPEMGAPTATVKPLFCGVTDKTIDAAGRPVPTRKLPDTWPFHGPQDPAPMSMKKQGGTWLVDLDGTGLGQ